jgi:transcriptional regulator with XRE-family HTH domain
VERSFASSLRQWRNLRKLSQMELAFRAGLSQRHLSFLETGRAQPSRESVLQICTALDVPLRERNTLLTHAGFASVYPESAVPAPGLAHARRALELLLKQQEPYPALVLDPLCNIVMANAGLETLGKLFPVTVGQGAATTPPNLIHLMLHPGGMRQYLQGWEQLARRTLEHLRCERANHPHNQELAALEVELAANPAIRQPGPFLSEPLDIIELRNGSVNVRLFSMLTTFWPANDVTLSELRIELLFPADAATEDVFHKVPGFPAFHDS